jgi:hypothetical protein
VGGADAVVVTETALPLSSVCKTVPTDGSDEPVGDIELAVPPAVVADTALSTSATFGGALREVLLTVVASERASDPGPPSAARVSPDAAIVVTAHHPARAISNDNTHATQRRVDRALEPPPNTTASPPFLTLERYNAEQHSADEPHAGTYPAFVAPSQQPAQTLGKKR